MRLASLECFGFKSFANRFSLEFGPGITAIVGPNGCGKTNVAEALRWVLGEQNPRQLRSERSEDVIFNGSRDRKSLGMAEVSLSISNPQKILPIDFSEVEITRRLYRSGESEYLLNRSNCRLKDITNLFIDTGIGQSSYSLIESRMIDAVLSDRAEDRRLLLEQAAGITRYKARRKTALRRLEATSQDLLRLGDVIKEVEAKVRSLNYQVGKARRYRKYIDEIKRHDLALSGTECLKLKETMEPAKVDIDKAKDDLAAISARVREGESELEKVQVEIIEGGENLRNVQLGLADVQRRLEGIERALIAACERQDFLTRRRQEVAREQSEAENSVKEIEAESKQFQEQLTAAQSRLAEARAMVKAAFAELKAKEET